MTPVDGRRISRHFFAQLDGPPGLDVLFGHLPDVYMFAKDRKGRFVRCNQAFVRLVHKNHEDDVLGRRDLDFFPRHLAENYMRDDADVMTSDVPLIDKVELLRNADESIDWYSTTKIPLHGRKGTVIGLAGITRDLKKMKSNSVGFLSLAPVLETILSDFAQPLSVASLAAKASLSISQFDRQFTKRFQTTPRKYITNVRVNAACELLVSTDLPISDIALRTGFYDQSHFSNAFARAKKMAPSRYRKMFAVVSS